jgi:hypothetical protein
MCAAKTYPLTGPDGQPYERPAPGTLGGHRRGKLYGRLDCPAALRAIADGGYTRHRVFFADESIAIAADQGRPAESGGPSRYPPSTSEAGPAHCYRNVR